MCSHTQERSFSFFFCVLLCSLGTGSRAQGLHQASCTPGAIEATKRDAEHESASAKKHLADQYMHGVCITRDPARAAVLYKESAEMGDPGAQYEFGLFVLEGKEVPKNETKAADWLRRSADQNYAMAQYALGSLYVQGRGVEKNLVEGYKWLRISGPDTDEHLSRVLALVAQSMTAEEIQKAKLEADTWHRTHRVSSR